jgi:two-component system, NtrC family, sensor kinase
MSAKPGSTISQRESGSRALTLAEGLDLDLFRQFFEEFPDPVLVIDHRNRVVFLNHSARCFTGRVVGEENGLACSEVLRMGVGDPPELLMAQCLARKILDGVPGHLKNCAGEWLPFSLSAQLVRDRGGEPIGSVAIGRNVASKPGSQKDQTISFLPSIINNFPMPFFTVNTELTITFMNDHLEGLTGYTSSEVVNRMTCAELFRTSQCHTRDCPIKRAMEERVPLAGLRRVIHDRDGRKIPVAVHASMITDSEQRVIGGFQALRDITPVMEAEQKIAMLFEITQEGILMADENHQVIYANAKMAEILDRPKEEVISKDLEELLPQQHLSIVQDLVHRVDPEHPLELRFCSTIPPSNASHPDYRALETCFIVSRVGKSVISCMYYHDLTKHIEIERQLHKANSFLNNIIRSSPDGIVVVDKEGQILIFNEGAERILGYTAKEVVGNSIATSKIYSPEVAREIMRRMRSNEYGPPGKVTFLPVTLTRKDGEEVPVNFSAAIIRKDDTEIGSVGIFSDLRERLRIRKELEQAKIQLMQAEKIASVGRLAAGVAHEINNPLSGILLYADILMNDLADNPQWSADLKEIIDQTIRCKHIVTRLLEFSRQSVGQRVPYDINAIIERSVELLARQALFQDVEFVIDLQLDIPEMTGDPGQLQQVFTNLIINAGSAMKGKGKIVVTSRFDADCEEVSLQFFDTGPGISLEVMDKIFEPFFTTKRPGEGTGLGLSVAYGIIQQHGGTIEVKNSHAGGAIFTITLPLESPENLADLMC